ncbi:MAG: hypothetical protein GYB31_01065 [Bacteroidetes bacterium]|nr:hypothetical protein [Bacteroidota bacterium]
MKRLALLLAVASMFVFTGCIEILEQIYLEKGGSGKYQITIDMSAMMDESVQDMLGQFGEEDAASQLKGIELDSLIMLEEVNKEAISNLDKPEVFKGSQLRMIMSDSRDEMIMKMSMNFTELDDISYFTQHLGEVMGEGGMDGMSAGLVPEGTNLLSLKGRKLTRHPAPADVEQMFSEDEMAMARMMFDGATFTSIYHFPGKVRKTSIPGAEVDGNMVKVESDMLDIMSNEEDLSGVIKFKWR